MMDKALKEALKRKRMGGADLTIILGGMPEKEGMIEEEEDMMDEKETDLAPNAKKPMEEEEDDEQIVADASVDGEEVNEDLDITDDMDDYEKEMMMGKKPKSLMERARYEALMKNKKEA